ncbi:hypothetical protein, partial [Marinobacter sp.]|uniref:hypothetical protein n=1 Tax=Marinobacter sp. TaxID=50741 RepID=UPI0035C6AE34
IINTSGFAAIPDAKAFARSPPKMATAWANNAASNCSCNGAYFYAMLLSHKNKRSVSCQIALPC